ncbi:MAG: FHA domain-containing protein [Deltaproteobacteria bacterium]|nr:MAG: FHA domain-containing protein [Deltaproteobacteria bacterium]
MFKLVIQDDEGKTTVVPLIRDEITIGRKEGNTIRLTERNVSRRHARIHRINGTITIEDLNSYNGILVNGSRIQGRVPLKESDRIQIGDYLIELKSERADQPGPAARGSATAPMERVDPHAVTPVPEPVDAVHSDAATRPVAASAAQPAPVAVADAPTAAARSEAAQEALPFGDTDPAVATVAAPVARLVVLSSNFAGQEFPLDKPAVVIGRTDDNDIVINHRSISRHHAKIVQEQGRYAIVDLQSSNGVRVNGEDYGKVELRRGDVIDLGHVRLRFVEAGEDFVLGRDAEIVDLTAETAKGGRGWLWAALAILVVGGGAAVFALGGGKSATPPAGGANSAAAGRDVRPAVPAPKQGQSAGNGAAAANAIATNAPADAAGGGGVADHLATARRALEDERWADMQAAALEALTLDPNNAEARRLKAQAERELRNEMRYTDFQTAAAKRAYAAAKSAFAAIDRDSVYRLRAQPELDALRDQYIAELRREAATHTAARDCRAITRMAIEAGKLWVEARSALDEAAAACRKQAAVAIERPKPRKPPERKPPERKPPERKPPEPVRKPPPVNASPDELADAASEAAKKHNYGRANKLCEDALEIQPTHPRARLICTIAACRMSNEKRARRHYARLSEAAKRSVKQLCAQQGIQLD